MSCSKPPGELALGAADDVALVGEALEGAFAIARRPADRVELVLVLDRAQLLDEAARAGRARCPPGVEPRVARDVSEVASKPIAARRAARTASAKRSRCASTTSKPSIARAVSAYRKSVKSADALGLDERARRSSSARPHR